MAEPIVEVLGVYDADGGVRGELAYVVGHLLGRTECALCDVTHGGLRRKPAWDAMTADLPVPVRLAHRNELSAPEADAVEASGLPVVLGARADGSLTVLVPPLTLGGLGGSVEAFGDSLRAALDDEGVA
ncbi:hypothetical protein JQN72_14995 [Phycicoccus sp. CSK15P-2]|uniref:hypothetical protein n=1 Tax=Phycicoccus sp. CSK15P-2 TaxID=2807627 RepID=UPI0019528EFA|nr:hypothetical protein [Phycicoccus sp. CSK15P-2]MBM6405550.1 hypothetical protein [Phycicoccus sp. CSK15P-2]